MRRGSTATAVFVVALVADFGTCHPRKSNAFAVPQLAGSCVPVGGGLNVSWPRVDGAVLYELQLAKAVNSSTARLAWTTSITSLAPEVQAMDLEDATDYVLKTRSTHFNEVSGWTAWTDTFHCQTNEGVDGKGTQRTRSHPPAPTCEGCQFMSIVRISERNATEIDFLSNHDSGDYEGDSAFMTAMGSGGRFIHDFNESIIAQYCIEVAPDEFADYVSCNPPDTIEDTLLPTPGFPNATQICECVNEMDRRIGHQNATPACGPDAQPWALCNCSAASTNRSDHFVGAMDIFLPWVCGSSESGDGTCDVNLPFGHWYSTPAHAQCADDDPIGTDGCTWRRLPTAHVVRGWQLVEAGWNGTAPDWNDPNSTDQFRHNAKVLQDAFETLMPHPCGSA